VNGDGFGLGLAIVKSVAALHGAHIDARCRSGGGLDVRVVMPRATLEQEGSAVGSQA
jgi:signal transduction histidine kinase